jgi:hypothetical protein
MQFMSIEVTSQSFLFPPANPEPRLTLKEVLHAARQNKGKARRTEVSFSHNHLHDLESLWWVAVWMVFYNYFSDEGTSPSVTRRDASEQLRLAETLFPLWFDSFSRHDGFKDPWMFKNTCAKLPSNKATATRALNFFRQLLISHYCAVEKEYTESVDLGSSEDDIYDLFVRVFSKLETHSHGLKLDFIPTIYEELSAKGESSKHPRSESESIKGYQSCSEDSENLMGCFRVR